ncbi:MAG: hypothetical protein RIQ74_1733 [Pseudomonadota bacterium]|jgi:hypothetical protein
MPFIKNFPKASWRLAKIAIGGAVLTGLAVGTIAYAQAKPLPTVDKVELDKYWVFGMRLHVNRCFLNVNVPITLQPLIL